MQQHSKSNNWSEATLPALLPGGGAKRATDGIGPPDPNPLTFNKRVFLICFS